jgi:sulfite reductase (ferredoxin)
MNIYGVYVGGDYEGTRITKELSDNVPLSEMEGVIDRLFAMWKEQAPSDRFGDFTHRMPLEELQKALPAVRPAQ